MINKSILFILILFSNSKTISQTTLQSDNILNSKQNLENLNILKITKSEKNFLLKNGFYMNYKWDNEQINQNVNYILYTRKKSNVSYYYSLGTFIICGSFLGAGILTGESALTISGAVTLVIPIGLFLGGMLYKTKALIYLLDTNSN